MSYKQGYLTALKDIKIYKTLFLFLYIILAIFILSNMNLFFGYWYTTILFYYLIEGSIKRLLSLRKEIKSIEETSL